jgi:hypothetical protein
VGQDQRCRLSLHLSWHRGSNHCIACDLVIQCRIIRMRTSVTCGYDRTRVQSAARERRGQGSGEVR